MSDHKFKRENKKLLLYYLVLPLKYRRKLINKSIGLTLKEICEKVSFRYEIKFIEIGYESGHVHFLVQSVPGYSVLKIGLPSKFETNFIKPLCY